MMGIYDNIKELFPPLNLLALFQYLLSSQLRKKYSPKTNTLTIKLNFLYISQAFFLFFFVSLVMLKNTQNGWRTTSEWVMCVEYLPALNHLCVLSSWLVWQAENTASAQGLPRERSPVGSRFSESLLLDVPGRTTEQVRICEFRRISSSLHKAPKTRDSFRLNSLERFLVTPLQSLQKPGWCTLEPFPNQVCFVIDCSLYFLVFLSKLVIFSYSSTLQWFWAKAVSVEKTELIF